MPLSSLQKTTPSYSKTDSLPSGVTLSFLENQLASCILLNSPAEYKHWLLATIEHLLDKGPECRLRFILDDLMGPTHKSAAKQNTKTIMVSLNPKIISYFLYQIHIYVIYELIGFYIFFRESQNIHY